MERSDNFDDRILRNSLHHSRQHNPKAPADLTTLRSKIDYMNTRRENGKPMCFTAKYYPDAMLLYGWDATPDNSNCSAK